MECGQTNLYEEEGQHTKTDTISTAENVMFVTVTANGIAV